MPGSNGAEDVADATLGEAAKGDNAVENAGAGGGGGPEAEEIGKADVKAALTIPRAEREEELGFARGQLGGQGGGQGQRDPAPGQEQSFLDGIDGPNPFLAKFSFDGWEYKFEGGKANCVLCKACDSAITFRSGGQSPEEERRYWIEVKKAIKRHMDGPRHIHKLRSWQQKQEQQEATEIAGQKATLAAAGSWLLPSQHGYSAHSRPEFTARLPRNGVAVRDIGRGKDMGGKALGALYRKARANFSKFLGATNPTTGRRPAAAFPFDPLTWGRRASVLVGCAFFFCGEMESIFLGAPLIGQEPSGVEVLSRVKFAIEGIAPIEKGAVVSLSRDGDAKKKSGKRADVLGLGGWPTLPIGHCP